METGHYNAHDQGSNRGQCKELMEHTAGGEEAFTPEQSRIVLEE